MLSADDQLAIRRLADLYGYLIDERRFSALEQVFTEDVVYDATDFGLGVATGLESLRELWRGAQHPLAHHAVNVLAEETGPGQADVIVKGLGVGPRGRVGSVTYFDQAVRTPDGWRLAARRAVLRRPEAVPAES